MYIFFIFYFLFFIHIILIENNFLDWKKIFFFILFQVFTVDISGYMAGKVLGKNKIKILKGISPNKTLEGYFGSILIGFVAGFIYLSIIVLENPINFSTKLLLIFSVIFCSIFGSILSDYSNIYYH